LPVLAAVLRSANEHLDQIVVKAVEKLPLEGPLKLRITYITWMEFEIVRVHRWVGEFGPNDNLYRILLVAAVELN